LAEINIKYPQKMALHFEPQPKAPPAKSITCAPKHPQKRVGLNGFAVAALLRAGAYPVERLERGFRPLGGGRSYDNSVA
jgi:hypothetical protein